uniref:Uncharacterized protein n=1 Tax=Oryza punctata TaxID=4537 RepID=A0A0E0MJT1_ORYPU
MEADFCRRDQLRADERYEKDSVMVMTPSYNTLKQSNNCEGKALTQNVQVQKDKHPQSSELSIQYRSNELHKSSTKAYLPTPVSKEQDLSSNAYFHESYPSQEMDQDDLSMEAFQTKSPAQKIVQHHAIQTLLPHYQRPYASAFAAEIHVGNVAGEHLVASDVLAEAVKMIDEVLLHAPRDSEVHEALEEADDMPAFVDKIAASHVDVAAEDYTLPQILSDKRNIGLGIRIRAGQLKSGGVRGGTRSWSAGFRAAPKPYLVSGAEWSSVEEIGAGGSGSKHGSAAAYLEVGGRSLPRPRRCRLVETVRSSEFRWVAQRRWRGREGGTGGRGRENRRGAAAAASSAGGRRGWRCGGRARPYTSNRGENSEMVYPWIWTTRTTATNPPSHDNPNQKQRYKIEIDPELEEFAAKNSTTRRGIYHFLAHSTKNSEEIARNPHHDSIRPYAAPDYSASSAED